MISERLRICTTYKNIWDGLILFFFIFLFLEQQPPSPKLPENADGERRGKKGQSRLYDLIFPNNPPTGASWSRNVSYVVVSRVSGKATGIQRRNGHGVILTVLKPRHTHTHTQAIPSAYHVRSLVTSPDRTHTCVLSFSPVNIPCVKKQASTNNLEEQIR